MSGTDPNSSVPSAVQPGVASTAVPGWYADPWDQSAWRWWDGAVWTAGVSPGRLALPSNAGQGGLTQGGPTSRRPILPRWLSVPVAVCLVPVALFLGVVAAGAPLSFPLALIPMVFVVPVLWWLDRVEPEPLSARIHAFLWGASVAVAGSLGVNILVESLAGSTAAAVISAPLIEEAMKGLGVVWALRRREIDSVSDGLIFAGWVALGFAVAEDITYFAGTSGGSELAAVVIIRAFLSPFAHPLFTCWTGAAIGFTVRRGASLFPAVLIGYVAAVFLHALWNGSLTMLQDSAWGAVALVAVAVFFVIFIATAILVVRLRRSDERVVAAAVPQLAQRFGLTAAEVAVFSNWSTTLASRAALDRSQRRRFDRLHAGISALAQRVSSPAGIQQADAERLMQQIDKARNG